MAREVRVGQTEDRGHGGTLADRRFSRDVIAFLLADHSPKPRRDGCDP